MTTIPDAGKTILDAPEFATIATMQPDGQPHLSVVWVERDGDDVLVSTVKGRQKHRNIERNPRVTLLAFPKAAPYTYVEIRGSAVMTEEGGRELIDRLCTQYTGAERYTNDDGTDNVRVVVRITPTKVVIR
jgi:PPOX class probable F420-dependent enzyme